jgi:hypothetical protein
MVVCLVNKIAVLRGVYMNIFDDKMDALLYTIAEKYKSMPPENNGISDCLTIGVDFEPDLKNGCLVVMRQNDDEIYVLNQFRNEEALELYNKLIGVRNAE